MTDIPATASNHNTLAIQGLCKYFFGLRALDGVSFALSRGEILGLIGPNGSGKTTLINVVTGLLPATSGQVFVDGQEITNKKPYQIARDRRDWRDERDTKFQVLRSRNYEPRTLTRPAFLASRARLPFPLTRGNR